MRPLPYKIGDHVRIDCAHVSRLGIVTHVYDWKQLDQPQYEVRWDDLSVDNQPHCRLILTEVPR